MKKIITLLALMLCSCWSASSLAFTCQSLGQPVHGLDSTISVHVNLTPSINAGENLVVDLSQSIQCRNDAPQQYLDPIRIGTGAAYQGALKSFTGSISYFGNKYPFPLNSPTASINHTWGSYRGWQTTLYLTPISTASGVVINAGDLFASLILEKLDLAAGTITQRIVWNLYANNSVVIPTGGCDVSARDVTVNLPNYPGSTAVPVSVHCAKNQQLGYYLSGTTDKTSNSIFSNTASGSPAKGIGVQLLRNGTALPTRNTISLGTVGTSPVNLGLTAAYARTSGQLTAGNVQSIIGVTFVYQ